MTLQEQFNSIKNGKGNKDQFLKQARHTYPQYLTKFLDFDTSVNILKSKQLINEAIGGVVTKGFNITDWKQVFETGVKATEKETSKEVKNNQAHAFQPSDMENADNINFNEIMKGFYAEMYDEKNKKKTGDEIKAMVVKNLAKDPLYYTKNGNFSTMGVGYTDEAPGLGKNTQPTSKEASVLGGRDKVNSESEIVKNSLVGSAKKNVKDSLGDSEAKDSMPKKVKEMPDKGVSGVEKTMKLQENLGHNEINSITPEGRFWIVTYRTMDGTKEKVFNSEKEARQFLEKTMKSQEGVTNESKSIKTATQNGDKSYNVTYDDGTKDVIAVSNDAWDEINKTYSASLNESKLRSVIAQIIKEELNK